MSNLSSVNHIIDGEDFEAVVANRPHRDLMTRDEELLALISSTSASVSYSGYHNGILITRTGASQVTINEGQVASDDGIAIMNASSIVIDGTVSGANGLDTGSLNNSYYHIWIIRGLTAGTEAGLLSLSASSPTMPGGYVYKRRVGVVRRFSGSFLTFIQDGNRYHYATAHSIYSSSTERSSYRNEDVTNYIPTIVSKFGIYSIRLTGERIYFEVDPLGTNGVQRVLSVGTYDGTGTATTQLTTPIYNDNYLRWRHNDWSGGHVNDCDIWVNGFLIRI